MVIAGFDYSYFGPNMVRLGEFDRVLIRPASAFVQVLTAQFTLKRLGRIGQGVIVLGWALIALGGWTPLKLAYLAIIITSAAFSLAGCLFLDRGCRSGWWNQWRR